MRVKCRTEKGFVAGSDPSLVCRNFEPGPSLDGSFGNLRLVHCLEVIGGIMRNWRSIATLGTSLVIALLAGGLFIPSAQANSWNPGPVSDIQASAGDGTLTISWTAANPGSSTFGRPYVITGYTVRATVPGVTGTVATCTTQGTSCTLTGLRNGVDHFIQVTARNSGFGESNVWGAGPFKPCCSRPSAPGTVAAVAGDTTASVSWTPPSNTVQSPGPYVYSVQSSPAGLECRTGDLTCSFAGLTNGTTYTFFVYVTNNFGTSSAGTSPAVKPIGLPGPARDVVGFVQDRGRVNVTWSGPESTGGTDITRYVATASPGGANCATDGELSCTISGLSNGKRYTFSVIASNVVGSGPVSAASPVAQPLAGPSAPTSIRASAGRGTATVTWKRPKSTGGTRITEYVVRASPGGQTCKTKATRCSFSGLSDNTTYRFSVQAFNSKGAGAPAQSRTVTTAPTPPPPPPPPKPDVVVS